MFYFSIYQLMGGIKIVSKQIVLKWLQNKFMNPVKCKNDVIQWKNASLCNNKKTATTHYLMTPYKSRLALEHIYIKGLLQLKDLYVVAMF